MKSSVYIFLFLIINSTFLEAQECRQDRACAVYRNQYPSGVFSTNSADWLTPPNNAGNGPNQMNGGNWTLFNVEYGSTYEWTFCSSYGGVHSAWDAELTLSEYTTNNTNNRFLCYSDDNCSGTNAPFIRWTADFTGTVVLLTTQYNCFWNNNAPYNTLVWKRASITSCTIPDAPSLSINEISSTNPNGTYNNIDQVWSSVNGANGYEVSYSFDGNSWIGNYNQGSNLETQWPIGGYPNGIFYSRVRSYKNCNNNTYYSNNWTYSSPNPIYTACNDPSAPSISGVTNTTLNITLNNDTPVSNPYYTNYAIYCSTTNEFVQSDGSLGANEYYQTKANWGTKTVTGLNRGTNYCFYVVAENMDGDLQANPSNESCANTSNICITWIAGTPEPIVQQAAEFICNYNNNQIIDNQQNLNTLNSFSLKDACKVLANTLFPQGIALPSDNFPTPFSDIETLTYDDKRAIKAMLYLELEDGYSPLSRDFFMVFPAFNIRIEQVVRLVLEARGIAPDWMGYNTQSSASSSFCCDVKINDLYYGWYKKANDLGLLNDLYINCNTCPSGRCFNTNYTSYFTTWKSLYILLYRVLSNNSISTPTITQNSFFTPNNFTIANAGSETDIRRGVFNAYEQNSFSLPQAGLPLEFSHRYSSNMRELPVMSYPFNNIEQYWNNALIALNPVGVGWTHDYNTIIQRAHEYDFNLQRIVDKKLYIKWADGTTHVYNYVTGQYETKGVYDKLDVNLRDSNNSPTKITITKPNQIKYIFIADGWILKLHRIEDRNSNRLILDYENRNCYGGNSLCAFSFTRLKVVRDSLTNRAITFNYQLNNDYINSVTDGTRTISFNVNTNTQNLESFTDAKNQITAYYYCGQDTCKNLLTSIILPKGNTINNTYAKRKLKQTSTGTYTAKVNFTTAYGSPTISTSSTVTVTPVNGQTITSSYNHNADGNVSNFSSGNPNDVASQTSNVSFTYGDVINNPTLPTIIVDNKTGITETFSYDMRGNVLTHTKSASGVSTVSETFTYNLPFNDPLTHVDANSSVTNYTYNTNGNLIQLKDPLNGITQSTVDSRGLVTSSTNPSGLQTLFGYNAYGNLSSIRKNLSPTASIITQAGYDNISRVTSITNPKGIQTAFQYDNNDNTTKETEDPTGLNIITNYTFDANDNSTNIQNANGNSTVLTYDFATDDLTQESFGGKNKFWSYNTDGSLNTYRDKANNLFTYQYYTTAEGKEGLLKNDGYAEYNYNATTKSLSTITRGSKVLTYSYDGFQRVTGVNYNDFTNNNVTYQYDANNNITRITYPDGKYFIYEWDLNSRLVKITDWQGRVLVQYYYLLDGRLLYEVHGNSTTTNYHYDAVGRLDSLINKKANGGLIGYRKVTLDAVGNILSEKKIDTDNNFIPNLTTQTNNYVNDATNRQTSINSVPIVYDGNGNQTSFQGEAFTWDILDNLLTATQPTGNLTFDYDPLENRRLKNNTRYVLDILNGSNVLAETDLNGTPTSIYVHGLGLVCRLDVTTNTYSYYHYDFLGSTTAITDATGNSISNKYIYDPDGNIFQNVELFSQSFKYVGKYGVMYDAPNLTFMRARYYNAKTGRFLSEDPIWSTNLFTYADNNAMINIDPDGRATKKSTAKAGKKENVLVQTYIHYQVGAGKPITMNTSSLNLGNASQKNLVYNSKNNTYSLDTYKVNPKSQTALALGKITLVSQGNNQYSVAPDYYDFNNEKQKGLSKRNIATFIAGRLHNNAVSNSFGGPFMINFNGSIRLKP